MTGAGSRGSRLGRKVAIAVALIALLAAAGAGGASATRATAATGLPRMCTKAGLTPGMVRKIFGPKAEIAGYGVVVSADCPIVWPNSATPATGCADGGVGCQVTDVILGRASYYSQWVSNAVYYLDLSGKAHKAKFSGAGPKAVLLTSTEGYGGTAEPTVLFKTKSDSIQIESSLAGRAQPTSVIKLWKQLAHAMYTKLSK
jgi:hypothetical protein